MHHWLGPRSNDLGRLYEEWIQVEGMTELATPEVPSCALIRSSVPQEHMFRRPFFRLEGREKQRKDDGRSELCVPEQLLPSYSTSPM